MTKHIQPACFDEPGPAADGERAARSDTYDAREIRRGYNLAPAEVAGPIEARALVLKQALVDLHGVYGAIAGLHTPNEDLRHTILAQQAAAIVRLEELVR